MRTILFISILTLLAVNASANSIGDNFVLSKANVEQSSLLKKGDNKRPACYTCVSSYENCINSGNPAVMCENWLDFCLENCNGPFGY
jgi:hypothetical protein